MSEKTTAFRADVEIWFSNQKLELLLELEFKVKASCWEGDMSD